LKSSVLPQKNNRTREKSQLKFVYQGFCNIN